MQEEDDDTHNRRHCFFRCLEKLLPAAADDIVQHFFLRALWTPRDLSSLRFVSCPSCRRAIIDPILGVPEDVLPLQYLDYYRDQIRGRWIKGWFMPPYGERYSPNKDRQLVPVRSGSSGLNYLIGKQLDSDQASVFLTVFVDDVVRKQSPDGRNEWLRLRGWRIGPALDTRTTQYPWDHVASETNIIREVMVYTKLVFHPRFESCWLLYNNYSRRDPRSSHFRLSSDRYISHGDGGLSLLSLPVWVTRALPIRNKLRLDLWKQLYALDRDRQDIQDNNVVHDIVDPDLYPNYFDDNSVEAVRLRIRQRYQRIRERTSSYGVCRVINRLEGDVSDAAASSVREHYRWVPTDVTIDSTGNVEFLSCIQGLPLPQFERLTKSIATVFEKMVPMFAELGVLNEGVSTSLQVVVKIQRYSLPPFSTYTGKWHMEGRTENVVAVGVYYVQVDTDGGNLKFRCENSPSSSSIIPDAHRDFEVPVETGTAVAFANSVPHRFRKITRGAKLSSKGQRLFINFFILDPLVRIPSTSDLLLTAVHERQPELRARARQHMSMEKNAWGCISWGNCGTLNFLHPNRTTFSDVSQFREMEPSE